MKKTIDIIRTARLPASMTLEASMLFPLVIAVLWLAVFAGILRYRQVCAVSAAYQDSLTDRQENEAEGQANARVPTDIPEFILQFLNLEESEDFLQRIRVNVFSPQDTLRQKAALGLDGNGS